MTEIQRFELVLEELHQLLRELYKVGLDEHAVLIGAQVVALEQRSRDAQAFQVALPSGIEIRRGFSLEPDLVIDTDDLDRLEALPQALRARGFERSRTPGRPSRWTKTSGAVLIELDLFTTADCDESQLPTPMTRLRGAPQLRLREVRLTDQSRIKVPDAHAYLSLKLEAWWGWRPRAARAPPTVRARGFRRSPRRFEGRW